MRRLYLAVIVHVLISPVGAALHSQLPPSLVENVPRNTLIRVADGSRAPVYGRRLNSSRDSLILSAPAPQRYAFALVDIDTLWLQKGTAWKEVGAAGGLTLGLLAAAIVYSLTDTPCERSRCVIQPVVVGASIGFGIGGTLGALVPRWRRVYPGTGR